VVRAAKGTFERTKPHVAAALTGAVLMDGAILVCSGADGTMLQTKEHIVPAYAHAAARACHPRPYAYAAARPPRRHVATHAACAHTRMPPPLPVLPSVLQLHGRHNGVHSGRAQRLLFPSRRRPGTPPQLHPRELSPQHRGMVDNRQARAAPRRRRGESFPTISLSDFHVLALIAGQQMAV
jgi:hypothetical protein